MSEFYNGTRLVGEITYWEQIEKKQIVMFLHGTIVGGSLAMGEVLDVERPEGGGVILTVKSLGQEPRKVKVEMCDHVYVVRQMYLLF